MSIALWLEWKLPKCMLNIHITNLSALETTFGGYYVLTTQFFVFLCRYLKCTVFPFQLSHSYSQFWTRSRSVMEGGAWTSNCTLCSSLHVRIFTGTRWVQGWSRSLILGNGHAEVGDLPDRSSIGLCWCCYCAQSADDSWMVLQGSHEENWHCKSPIANRTTSVCSLNFATQLLHDQDRLWLKLHGLHVYWS